MLGIPALAMPLGGENRRDRVARHDLSLGVILLQEQSVALKAIALLISAKTRFEVNTDVSQEHLKSSVVGSSTGQSTLRYMS